MPSNLSSDVSKPSSSSAVDMIDFLKGNDPSNGNGPDLKPDTSKDDKDDKTVKKPEVKDDKTEDDKDGKEDDIKLVDDEDDDTIDLDEDDEDEDKDEEDDEDDEKDEDKDEEDEIEIDAPPKIKQVLAKFPTLFKEFKWFRGMMYRDKAYSELFGSFDNAKEAHGAAEMLAEFGNDLAKGSIGKTLSAVKSNDPKAFDKIVDNYMTTLYNVDQDAYREVAGRVYKGIIKNMYDTAKKNNDTDMMNVAAEAYKFVYGTTEYEAPKNRVNEKEEKEEDKVSQKEQEFNERRYNTVKSELSTKIENVLTSTITEYIDPKGQMSAYVKKNAIKDALNSIYEILGNNKAFGSLRDRAWEEAFRADLSDASVGKIRSLYLSRAKKILPEVLKKARAEALKDSKPSRKISDEDEETDRKPRQKREIHTGSPRRQGGKPQIKPGESAYDFLSRDD